MDAKAYVIGLTVVVGLGGGYLYRATRSRPTAGEPPAAVATTAAPTTPAPAAAPAPRAARSLDAVAPTTAAIAPGSAAPRPTATPPPVGTPGVHLEVRDRLDDAPGLADPSDRARGDLTPPAEVDPEVADALASARAAFRAGDYAAARGTAEKLLARAPDNDAARRLAVSSSCRLRDGAAARAAAATIPPNQRAAVTRYCAAAGVSLDAAP